MEIKATLEELIDKNYNFKREFEIEECIHNNLYCKFKEYNDSNNRDSYYFVSKEYKNKNGRLDVYIERRTINKSKRCAIELKLGYKDCFAQVISYLLLNKLDYIYELHVDNQHVYCKKIEFIKSNFENTELGQDIMKRLELFSPCNMKLTPNEEYILKKEYIEITQVETIEI